MQEKTYVFLDAGYLSIIAKEFFKGYPKYGIREFANCLAKERGLWCAKTFFFTAPPFQGTPPTPDEASRKARYDSFISKLKKHTDIEVNEGRVQKINGEYTQKGVDTLVTMRLMALISQKQKPSSIILVACDTDFVPILNTLRENGVKVLLYYYTDKIRKSKFSLSNHLFTACDEKYLIRKEHFDDSAFK